MAHAEVCLCLVLLMTVGSNASFLRDWMQRTTTATATEEVSQECIALAEQGSCEFYTCFERRLPCGRTWYIAGQGLYYCNKMQRVRANFTAAGQSFLDDSSTCMTMALVEAYQQDMVDCHALKHSAVESISRCSIDNAFCSVFHDNARLFMNIYEPSDLLSRRSMQIWGQIGRLIGRCGGEGLRVLTQTIRQSIGNMAQSIGDRMRNFFNRNSN